MSGTPPDNLPDLIHAFLLSRARKRCAPATIAAYEVALRLFATHAGPGTPTTEQLDDWISTYRNVASAKSRLTAVRTMYNWAARTHGLPNVAAGAETPHGRRKLPRVYTQAELRRIFAAAQGDRTTSVLLTVLLDTGVRAGELASLRTEWIDEPDESGICAMRVQGKTGARMVPITSTSRRALMSIAPPSGPVFLSYTGPRPAAGRPDARAARPMVAKTLEDRIRRVTIAAGITGEKRGPHTFRHTFATHYLRAGGDIHRLQRILGHSDIKLTMVYLHLSDPEAFAEHARLTPLHLVTRPHQLALANPNTEEDTG